MGLPPKISGRALLRGRLNAILSVRGGAHRGVAGAAMSAGHSNGRQPPDHPSRRDNARDTDAHPCSIESHRRWARRVFEGALHRMESECREAGKEQLWLALHAWVSSHGINSDVADSSIEPEPLESAISAFKDCLHAALSAELGDEGVIRAEIEAIPGYLRERGWLKGR